jgi:hypothetical protein
LSSRNLKATSDGRSSEISRTSLPEGFDALPKRFKEYINGLASELRALQQTLDAEGETRITLETYSRSAKVRYLPNDARIRFALGVEEGRMRRVEVQLDRRRGSCGISVSSPDGRIVVLPEISNEVCIKVADAFSE